MIWFFLAIFLAVHLRCHVAAYLLKAPIDFFLLGSTMAPAISAARSAGAGMPGNSPIAEMPDSWTALKARASYRTSS